MRDPKVYLKDILEAIGAIERFVQGMDFETFINDDLISSAVIRKLEIIGEASKNVPEAIKQVNPIVPWKKMAGMRDKLIYFYFGIKYKLVWQTIKKDIPQIKPLILNILKESHP